MNSQIIIVDDELQTLSAMEILLTINGYSLVRLFPDYDSARETILTEDCDVLFLDISMPGTDGITALQEIMAQKPEQAVVMITGNSTVPTAVQAMKLGAVDFLMKPTSAEEILEILAMLIQKKSLQQTNSTIQDVDPVLGRR